MPWKINGIQIIAQIILTTKVCEFCIVISLNKKKKDEIIKAIRMWNKLKFTSTFCFAFQLGNITGFKNEVSETNTIKLEIAKRDNISEYASAFPKKIKNKISLTKPEILESDVPVNNLIKFFFNVEIINQIYH